MLRNRRARCCACPPRRDSFWKPWLWPDRLLQWAFYTSCVILALSATDIIFSWAPWWLLSAAVALWLPFVILADIRLGASRRHKRRQARRLKRELRRAISKIDHDG